MPMNRRQVVKMGAALGGAALMTAKAEGQFQEVQQAARPQPREARGKVTLYGEGAMPYFALSEMPEGVETFRVSERAADRIGRLVLTAAEKGWEVRVTYFVSYGLGGGGEGGGVKEMYTTVSDVRIESFGASP